MVGLFTSPASLITCSGLFGNSFLTHFNARRAKREASEIVSVGPLCWAVASSSFALMQAGKKQTISRKVSSGLKAITSIRLSSRFLAPRVDFGLRWLFYPTNCPITFCLVLFRAVSCSFRGPCVRESEPHDPRKHTNHTKSHQPERDDRDYPKRSNARTI